MDSEAKLIERAKDGDSEAFDALVRAQLPMIYSFLARYMQDESAAEDATQETFVKAWKNLHLFDAEKPLRPWLLSIARNSANDALRKKRSTPFSRLMRYSSEGDEMPFEDTLADDAPLPPEIFEQKELGASVQAALTRLNERDRAVLLLRYQDDLSFVDIAEVMKTPMNTVKSWHRRALTRLSTYLAESAPRRDTGT